MATQSDKYIDIRFDRAIHRELRVFAAEQGVPMAKAVKILLDYYKENNKGKE